MSVPLAVSLIVIGVCGTAIAFEDKIKKSEAIAWGVVVMGVIAAIGIALI